mgnify:CR=1 FL=1
MAMPPVHEWVCAHACRRRGLHQPQRLRAGRAGRDVRPAWVADLQACGASIDDVGEEHGRRVLKVRGRWQGLLTPLPPAVARAVERAVAGRGVLNRRGVRMDRHAVTRSLRRLAVAADVRLPGLHPHMLRHTLVTTMLDAGVDLRDVQIAVLRADPRATERYDRARKNLIGTRITRSPRPWRWEPERGRGCRRACGRVVPLRSAPLTSAVLALDVDVQRLREVCERYGVVRLDVFGSLANGTG